MPYDFGTHHCRNSSASVHASNTTSRGPSIVRVTTSSCSDVRSTVVRSIVVVSSAALRVSIVLLLPSSLRDDLLQLVEPCIPDPALLLDPRRLVLEAARAEPAGPHPPDLLGRDEAGLLQHPDVLAHAGEGHVECLGQIRDRRVAASQPLQHATAGGVREGRERGIESTGGILNHLVHFIRRFGTRCKPRRWERVRRSAPKGICRNKSSLATILANPIYRGVKIFNREARVEGEHGRKRRRNPAAEMVTSEVKAIVPEQLWDRVQAMLVQRRENR